MGMITQLPEFDTLVALYKRDPQAYEQVRTQLLRACIDNAPACHRPALEIVYQQIEAVRANAATPMEAAVGASRMMLESCAVLRDSLSQLVEATAAMETAVILKKFRL